MSAISEIYDAISTFLDTNLGVTGSPLVNPYEVEENPDIVLKRGFGFFLGPAQDQGTMTNMLMLNRDVIVTLTIETGAAQHNITKRQEAEKLLLEDQGKLIKELHIDPGVSEKVSAISYQADNGFEFVYGEKNNFLMIVSRFQMTYIENVQE